MLPRKTEFVDACLLNAKSATGTTVVLAEAVLLVEVKSITPDVTLAVLVTAPSLMAVAVIVTVAVALLTRLPSAQLTTPLVWLEVPCVVVADTNATLAGSASVNTTPLAGDGPRLVTMMV